jgi:hypothetical protein
MSSDAFLSGELENWPDGRRMASILRSAGLRIFVGRYSIRLEDFSHFTFQEYGGDLGDPQIEADAANAETLAAEASRVSEIFAKAGLVHRFEIYESEAEEMTHYFHYGWPRSFDPSTEAD